MVKIKLSHDTNGNKIVTVKIADLRAFSIQTNGNLPLTNSITTGSETEDNNPKIIAEVKHYVKHFGTAAQKKTAKFLPAIFLIFALFVVSCTSQQAKQEPQTNATAVKFTQKYTWVNNDQSKPQKCDTTITVILSNRVTIESREDGTEYQEDVNATNNVEITADGKITAFTVYTSDSTGVTYFNSQAKNTTIMQ